MKKIIMTLFLLFFATFLVACEDPNPEVRTPNYAFIEFQEEYLPLEEAIVKAYENDKKVLIDIYTDWCGFCRRMQHEVYPSKLVQEVIENYYYYVRIDAESSDMVTFRGETMTKRNFARALGATSYPSTVFLDSRGDPIGMQPGFMEAKQFSEILAFVGSDAFNKMSFEEFKNKE
jgi:thioredoxin-related protein